MISLGPYLRLSNYILIYWPPGQLEWPVSLIEEFLSVLHRSQSLSDSLDPVVLLPGQKADAPG